MAQVIQMPASKIKKDLTPDQFMNGKYPEERKPKAPKDGKKTGASVK